MLADAAERTIDMSVMTPLNCVWPSVALPEGSLQSSPTLLFQSSALCGARECRHRLRPRLPAQPPLGKELGDLSGLDQPVIQFFEGYDVVLHQMAEGTEVLYRFLDQALGRR